jgi:hypothetical protein
MKKEIHIITAGDSFSYNTQYNVKDFGKIEDLLYDNNGNWTNFLEYDLLKNKYNPTFYYLATPSFGNQLIIDSVLEQLNILLNNNIDKDNIQIFVQFTYFARNIESLPVKHIKTDEQKNDYFSNMENIENYNDVIIKNLNKIYNLAKHLESLNVKFKFFFQENLFTNDEYDILEIRELISKIKPYFLYSNEKTLAGMGENYIVKNSKNLLSAYLSTYDFHFTSIVHYDWYIDKLLPLFNFEKFQIINKMILKDYKHRLENKFLNNDNK